MRHPTCLDKIYEKLSKKAKDSEHIGDGHTKDVCVLVESILPSKNYELKAVQAKCICKKGNCSRKKTLVRFPPTYVAESDNGGMEVGKVYNVAGYPSIENGNLVILSPLGFDHSSKTNH